ncbi:MAG: GMC family oxidoreductase [Mesorhizobium sp.]|nr:GMC family oxidoreductase [Mesorhizobium sp.]
MSDADVIIVGAGVAGGLVGEILAQAGLRVVILEAGPRISRWALVERFRNGADRDNFMAPFPGTAHAPQGTGSEDDYIIQNGPDPYLTQYIRAVGGTTWHWAAACWRFLPNDFRLRSLYGVGRDWPIRYDDLEPYYQIAEQMMGVAGPHPDEEDLGSPRSEPYPMPRLPWSYMDTIFGETLNANGFEVTTEPVSRNSVTYDNRPACCGNNNCMPICPIAAQYSGDMSITKAEAHGARLVENAVVHFLETNEDGGMITAVRYRRPDGTEERLTADRVVIAAHGIETPKLMLVSRSEAVPRGLGNGSDQVGRYLMDHPGTGVSFLWGQRVYPGRGPQEMTSVVNFRDGEFRARFAAKKLHLGNIADLEGETDGLIEQGYSGAELDRRIRDRVSRKVSINSFHEQLPQFENRVSVSDSLADPLGIPRPEVTYRIGDYVAESARHTREAYARIAELLGGEEVEFHDDFAGNNHIMGTTIMGNDPRDSVVDSDCRVHEHPNLYIAGSSVFPTGGSVNSTLTLAALAVRLAHHLRDNAA